MSSSTSCAALQLLLLLLLLAHASPAARASIARPAVLSDPALRRLRGGDAGITIRVRTREGVKRLTMASDDATLRELQQQLQREHKLPLTQQRCLSRAVGGADPFGEADAESSLRELGVAHGTVLHLDLAPAAPRSATATDVKSPPPPPLASGSGGRVRRRRGTTMADFEAERAQFEIVLDTPKPAACSYVAVDRLAAKRFSDFLLDTEFEERRIAFLYGRWADREALGSGRAGVNVDVVYEPPQECSATAMAVANDTAAQAEIERAGTIAKSLGLTFVGFAYAHPPRYHLMEIDELSAIVRHRTKAIAADSRAADLFVGMSFRPVYEDEPIDADVTAEVYQPTEQFTSLVTERGEALVDAGVIDGGGHAGFTQESGLSFKMGPDTKPTADASYFFARVHDLAKPYDPPPYGSLRAAFPAANRGAPLRKFHLRTFLAKQREAGLPFATTIADFQLLLHASAFLPAQTLRRLCTAVASAGTASRTVRTEREAALKEAERLLYEYAGLDEGAPASAKGPGKSKAKKSKK